MISQPAGSRSFSVRLKRASSNEQFSIRRPLLVWHRSLVTKKRPRCRIESIRSSQN